MSSNRIVIDQLSISSQHTSLKLNAPITRIKAGTIIGQLIIDGEVVRTPQLGLVGNTYFELGVIFNFQLDHEPKKTRQL